MRSDSPPARVPLWLRIGWTVWVAVWVPFYWREYGPENFLWFCDMANFAIAVALWRHDRLLFSWSAVAVLLVQVAWTIDIAGALIFGGHPIGATEYMFKASIPLGVRLLSLFHVTQPVVLLWALRRFGYDRRAWLLQTATAWVVLPVCYFFFPPERNINWVWGPFHEPQYAVAPGLYLAACMLAYPLLLYLPTHAALVWLDRRWRAGYAPGA